MELKTISVSGLTVGAGGVTNPEELKALSPERLMGVLKNVEGAESILFWARADISAELFARYGNSKEKIREVFKVMEPTQLEFGFVNRLEMVGYGFLIDRELRRADELAPEFHVEVLKELGEGFNRDEFSGWLQKAITNKWTVQDLRRAMRQSNKTAEATETSEAGPLDFLTPISLEINKLTRRTIDESERPAAIEAVDQFIGSLSAFKSNLLEGVPR